jgi:type I restriction enzyme, S subunit
VTVNWRIVRLGSVCSYEKDQGTHANLPYVGLESIESGTGRFLGSTNAVSVKSATFRFSPEHVLYGRLRPYLNKVLLPEFQGHCSTEIFPLKPGPDLSRRYLFHWLSMDATVRAIDATSTGARMPRANMNAVLDIEIPVPPLAEQNRLVAILDEAFAGIATATANADRNLRNARELFDSKLFSLIGRSADGWPQKTLREIALDFGRGKSRHRPRDDAKLYGGPYPFIQTGDVRGAEHLITEFRQTYSEEGLAQSKLWPRGTLCITIAANIAETGVLDFEACFPDSVIGVVVDESQTSSKYLEYMLHTFKAELKAKGKGSAQDNINLATFENELFPIPSLWEQARVVDLLDNISSEVQRLEALYTQKLNALNDLKHFLFHQAFTGELTKSVEAGLAELVHE